MKRAILIIFSVHVCIVFEAVGQGNIDTIVNGVMQSIYRDVPSMERISAKDRILQNLIKPDKNCGFQTTTFFQATNHPIFFLIVTGRTPGRASRPVFGEEWGPSRYLYRFSQSNRPSINVLLMEQGARATQALKAIARHPDVGSFQRAVSDPQILQSFERACRPFCYEMPQCDFSDPYRRTDGKCNNKINLLLGASFTPQQRVLPNAYDNLIDAPRTRSVDNSRLPSARTVSNRVFQWTFGGMTPISAKFSTFLTNFGQFIDHDVISTPSETLSSNEAITDCCHPYGGSMKPEACFIIPVNIEEPDPHFPPYQTCMNFVRHTGAPPLGCKSGVREQVNERTSFLDGSMIYGSDAYREQELRANFSGRLATNRENLLPNNPQGCPEEIQAKYPCFFAGDHRQSETPLLTVPHVTWLRRHNLIADALRTATGITNDEILFQETKRIVIAELQHVTYNEFLPAILDDLHMNGFNLRSKPVGHAEIYNPEVDPRTINAVGAAAFRMGHTLIRNTVGVWGNSRKIDFPVQEHFEVPDMMYKGGHELMARWMSKEPTSKSDRFLVDGIRNRLFENLNVTSPTGETPSLDLGALNIQRGREHGLPSYNAYREFCGLPRAYFFAATYGGLVNHSPQSAKALELTYRHPDDIDLFAGGISEIPEPDSMLGPTFQCLIAFQFSLYKQGDRFWYERTFSEIPLAAFTKAQLGQIKQTTYAKIMCSVMSDIGVFHSFQPNVMLRSNIPGNSPLPCNVLLEGSRLGFDITPFAKQIMQLRGRRRQYPYLRLKSPINPSMRNILEILGQLPNGSNVFTPINPAAVLKVRRKGENMY